MTPIICVYNESVLATDDDVRKACAAIQRQLVQHFEPFWKCSAIVHFAKKGEKPGVGDWVFKLVDSMPEVQGALGYHSDEGVPFAFIDVKLCEDENVSWSSCLSHEVLEAVADPECVRCFEVSGKVYSLEVCDATEGSKKSDGNDYTIDGVILENFVTPNWFIPGSPAPWDFLGVLSGPLTRTSAGYDSTAPIGRWTQHTGEKTRGAKRKARKGSRRAVRADRDNGARL